MGKSSLELLRVFSFLNEDNKVADLKAIDPKDIEERLRYYHEQRSNSASKETEAIASLGFSDAAMLSSLSATNTANELGSKLLVHESLVVDDPLFDFAAPLHEHTKVEREAMGMSAKDEIDVEKLHNKVQYFSTLAPLIEAGFIHVLPVGVLHEAPAAIPFNVPKNYYRELVPSQAVEFVQNSVIVRPMERTSEGMIIHPRPNHERLPQICITFKEDEPVSHATFYQYRDFSIEGKNEDGSLRISWDLLNDKPMDEARYAVWKEQSINSAVGARLEAVAKEMRLANTLGAPYLTESTFEAELLARSGAEISTDANTLAVNFLEANSGLLNISDPTMVFRLRTEQAELFARFRLSLQDISEKLRGVAPDEFPGKARRLFEREVQPQIEEINAASARLGESAAKGLLQTSGGILLALLTGSAIPLASSILFAANGMISETIPAAGDYMRSRKKPEYIWKKLKK